jgi:hypothetical protein
MFNGSLLAVKKNDVMGNRDDLRLWNPMIPQVHAEATERMVPECTPDHQGQRMTAHQQAGYSAQSNPRCPSPYTTLHHRGSLCRRH